MEQETKHRKLNIPEFQEGETTWWVQGKDTKSKSARRKAARMRLYWTIFLSVTAVIFGGTVFAAIGYWIYYSFGPNEIDMFTPKAEIVHTFTTPHENGITDLVYSPDGLFLVTASDDTTAAVIDAQTGETLRRMEGHQQGVTSVAVISLMQKFSTDTNVDKEEALSALRILTGSKDIRTTLWNPEMNPPIQQKLGASDDVFGVQEENIFEIPPGHTKAIMAVALSADGRYALTGSLDHRYLLWDTLSHALVKADSSEEEGLGGDLYLPHNGPVLAVAFNPNGNSYASASEDCTVKLWDGNNDQLMQTFTGHNSAVTHLQFGSSGTTLLSAGKDRRVILWNLINGARAQIFPTENEVIGAALSPNERYVVSSMFENSAVLWDVKSAKKLAQFNTPARIVALAVSPVSTEDGIPLYVALATVDNQIIVFSTENVLKDIRGK
ncbi:MAG: WD40 repeat domain-containing protein [Planctomycetia bacterium]|nr:WD40 repeat domain-containing protein [Planctomycetia bacterium]